MKKRSVFSIVAILMCLSLSLALAGCGQRGNDADATDNPSTAETESEKPNSSEEPEDNSGGILNPNRDNPYFVRMDGDYYVYELDGCEIQLETDLSKYIDGDVFYLTRLAIDFGWEAYIGYADDRSSPDAKQQAENNPDAIVFSYLDDGNNPLGLVVGLNSICWEITYPQGRVTFTRYDVDDVDIPTYTMNSNYGTRTANMAQIIVLAYLFENSTPDSDDPLENILPRSGSYRVYQ